jgi:hypothetical protein
MSLALALFSARRLSKFILLEAGDYDFIIDDDGGKRDASSSFLDILVNMFFVSVFELIDIDIFVFYAFIYEKGFGHFTPSTGTECVK